MKKILLLASLLVFMNRSYGQTNDSENTLSSILKAGLGLQGIGLTFEPRLGNSFTTDFSLGAGGGYNITESSIEYQVLKPALYFSITPKYFYNIKRRINNGKSVQFNSGNYFGIRIKYNSPLDKKTGSIRNSMLTNVHWGMQRSIGNHWTFNAKVGAGHAYNTDYSVGLIYPALDFTFSYIILKLKK